MRPPLGPREAGARGPKNYLAPLEMQASTKAILLAIVLFMVTRDPMATLVAGGTSLAIDTFL